MKTGRENIHRRTDGRWEARIVVDRPQEGKTRYKYLYGKTYEEVLEKKELFLLEKGGKRAIYRQAVPISRRVSMAKGKAKKASGQNDACAGDILFGEVVMEWLGFKEPLVKESTFAYYTTMVENHILPALGNLPLSEITSDRISDFLLRKRDHGRKEDGCALADKTVADMKVLLKQILKYARDQGAIGVVPSCPSVPVRPKSISVLTRQEQELVERGALKEDSPFTLGILISLYGGPRIGEVCSLKWEDFDFQNGTIRINKTVSRIQNVENGERKGTRLVIGSPKTDCSLHTIPLPSPILKYCLERRGDDSTFVMTGTEKPMEPRGCLERFKRFQKRLGVQEHNWHCLRHTFATRCVENGVDIKSLSEIMGHSDVEITMQRYVHPSMDTKKEQVNKLHCLEGSFGEVSPRKETAKKS